MALLCLLLRENYPFSHFPMYSSFTDHTYFLHLTARDGTLLRTRQFGLSSSTLKKIFDRARRQNLGRLKGAADKRVLLADQAAGRALLHYLDGLSAGKPKVKKLLPGLQVEHVLIHQGAGELILETHTLAQHQ